MSDLYLTVSDLSHVAEVRRHADKVAVSLSFDADVRGKVALIVTELATNLVKHAGSGALVLGTSQQDDTSDLQVLSLDHGPGMTNVGECLRDGYSTTGSPGTGLGAVARLAQEFDLYSRRDMGTAILARVSGQTRTTPNGRRLEFGAVGVPKPGEELCGDAWDATQQAGRCVISVADGLGHGALAADASNTAMRLLSKRPQLPPADLLRAFHDGLQSTRGAAVAVAEVDLRRDTVVYSGVGNIAACTVTDAASRSMVSLPGIVGHAAPRYQEFTYPWTKEALLILHSDGLSTHWNLARYPGLSSRHPALIAGILFRDHRRSSDDVTVVVAREKHT